MSQYGLMQLPGAAYLNVILIEPTHPSYRRYPTGLKLRYAEGSLPQDAVRSISRSTRRRWTSLSAVQFFLPPGVDIFDSESAALMTALTQNKRLKQMLRAAFCLIVILRQLQTAFRLEIHHVSPLLQPLQRLLAYANANELKTQLLRCLPFSAHQLAAWSSRKICKQSLVSLCRRKHPSRLAFSEVGVIWEAALDKERSHWPLSSV